MKRNFLLTQSALLVPVLVGLLAFPVLSQAKPTITPQLISYVDHDLSSAQKYVLKVDGKPFYMTNIQIRLEKLRYNWGWDAAARDAIVGRAAADGFNTVTLPIHWSEVETAKDKFDWKILDEYLGLANKYNIRMELLWFGHNSGGMVQWLTPTKMRVPDYVMKSPGRGSPETASEYKIRRDLSPYTLDLSDMRLMARETQVLSKVMSHIATWDKANGSKHTVIGVQLNNEVAAFDFEAVSFTAAQVVTYMSGLGQAVQKSPYKVWTRLNCIWGMEEGRIDVNEVFRSTTGTGIDFVGVDLYKASPTVIRDVLPYKGKNYRMIMEAAAEVTDAAQMQLAALAGNNAYDYYDMCGPDGHALYDRSGTMGFVPHGSYIQDVRTVNKLLNSAMADIANNAQGYGLFVHNWAGKSDESTEGVDGVVFKPASETSQAISIHRSHNEIVLMNTKGGKFSFPDSLGVISASHGYFDKNDKWVSDGTVEFSKTGITPPAGVTVRLTTSAAPRFAGKKLQAEFASYGLGSFVESKYLGFAGNGYINMMAKGGEIRWVAVDGQSGGEKTIRFRYANGGKETHPVRILINGTRMSASFPPTGSWHSYKYVSMKVSFKSGKTNIIRMEATEDGLGYIDEVQIF